MKKIKIFFSLVYGKVIGVLDYKNCSNLSIKNIEIDKNSYKIFLCKDATLYTDTIHDSAIIIKKKIINGPSFQYRKLAPDDPGLANADSILNSVLKKGTPRFKKKIKGSVFSLLTGGGGNHNYWHWMFDVLPRFYLLEIANINIENIDYYLFPNLNNKFQKETLDLINILDNKRLSSQKYRHICANKIIVTDHPYNILNNPKKDSLNIPNWIHSYLRNKFLKKSLFLTKIENFPKKIYINRKDSKSYLRYIVNSSETEDLLKKNNFKSISLSDYSFADQVAIFYNAEEIIGLHGAGFANIIFCKVNAKILELQPETAGDIIKNLAIRNNLKYQKISSEPLHYNFKNQGGAINIDLSKLNKYLDSL
jgi:capsular polysaccharide biosynthesis protein